MNQDEFTNLIIQPDYISTSQLLALEEMATAFPYSQLIHFLIAKAYHEKSSPIGLSKVKKAALFATHREALKSLLNRKPTITSLQLKNPPVDQGSLKGSSINLAEKTSIVTYTTEVVFEKIEPKTENLEIKEEKIITETIISETVNIIENQLVDLDFPDEKPEPDLDNDLFDDEATDNYVLKQLDFEEDSSDDEPPLRLGYLNSAADEVEEFNRKMRKLKQQEIIDNFIKVEPRITSTLNYVEKEEHIIKKDLAERNTATPDSFVSENLANIMIKQGKTERAIEIFEKLILKIPEKRTYFATQIQDLKNSIKK